MKNANETETKEKRKNAHHWKRKQNPDPSNQLEGMRSIEPCQPEMVDTIKWENGDG
jgi:hypothetical protein